MKWDRIRDRAGVLAAVFGLLWWINATVYGRVSQSIGGTYLHGYVANGEYFIGPGHGLDPVLVSESVYRYSAYHYWTLCALALAAVPSALAYLFAAAVSRRRRRLVVRVTSGGMTLNGRPASIADAVDCLRAAMSMNSSRRPEIRVINDYDACDAPQHAVALQLELIRHKVLLIQEPPRGRP